MRALRHWYAHLTIVRRLVLSVAAAMTLVLLLTSALTFWRVESGLGRQLDQDLAAYHAIVVEDLETNDALPGESPGAWYQVFAPNGKVLHESDELPVTRLAGPPILRRAFAGERVFAERSGFLHPGRRSFQLEASSMDTPTRRLVVVSAISRRHRDEALRELLLQLAIADLMVLLAAAFVGYRTARGALDPVEQYRRAAADAGDAPGQRLPVPTERNDELSRLGHTFNELLGRLEESSAREHQFLADASHELRTPLTLLKAEVEYSLHQARTPQQTAATLRSVSAQTDRLVDLANRLLDLEELDSADVERGPVDLSALVSEAAQRHTAAFSQAGRSLSVNAPEVEVQVSERWLDAAVSNLIANALQHGAGDVVIDACTDAGRVRVTVTDQGPGFPTDFIDKAFDRFTRAESSRTSNGSGLGLALVAAVARDHGGTVRIADSAPGASVVLEVADGDGPC